MPRPSTDFGVLLRLSIAAIIISITLLASAADGSAALGSRFPPESIQSREQAEAALAAAAAERKKTDAEYKSRQRACYKKFQVNACLEKEHLDHQKVAEEINALELEADRFQRQQKSRDVADRRRIAAEERVQRAAAVAATEAKNREAYLAKQAEAERQQIDRDVARANKKPAPAKQSPSLAAAKRRVDDPEKRRINAQKQSEKEKDALDRRARMAKDREQKVADRAKRQQARIVKQQAESAGKDSGK